MNAAEPFGDEKNVSPRNKDAPVPSESRCVQDLAKLQDLGSLILLVLKVGISTKTREDQTAGRGITVSTRLPVLSSFHPFHSVPPSFAHCRGFNLRQKKTFLISPTSSVRLCSSTGGANGGGV